MQILATGDLDHPEFRQALAALEAEGAALVPNVDDALSQLRERNLTPSLIVVAQAAPGRIALRQIERLRQAAPLAPIVAVLGTWCEGELRTGKPWPGVIRTYWHQWPERFQRQWAAMQAGRATSWSLPAVASDEDRLLAADPIREAPRLTGLWALVARRWEMADMLADACDMAGVATVWWRPGKAVPARGVSGLVWDATDGNPAELAELRTLVARFGSAPIIALLNFPRRMACVAIREAGARSILGKPFMLSDLWSQLTAATVGVKGC